MVPDVCISLLGQIWILDSQDMVFIHYYGFFFQRELYSDTLLTNKTKFHHLIL